MTETELCSARHSSDRLSTSKRARRKARQEAAAMLDEETGDPDDQPSGTDPARDECASGQRKARVDDLSLCHRARDENQTRTLSLGSRGDLGLVTGLTCGGGVATGRGGSVSSPAVPAVSRPTWHDLFVPNSRLRSHARAVGWPIRRGRLSTAGSDQGGRCAWLLYWSRTPHAICAQVSRWISALAQSTEWMRGTRPW